MRPVRTCPTCMSTVVVVGNHVQPLAASYHGEPCPTKWLNAQCSGVKSHPEGRKKKRGLISMVAVSGVLETP